MSSRPYRLAAPPDTADDDPFVTLLMTHRLVAIAPEAGPMIALRLMASAGVRHLPVLDGPRCLGLVLETDVVRGLALSGDPAAEGRPLLVGRLCRPVPTVHPNDRRSTAAQRMHDAGIDAALVADGDRLLGIVTASDLIRSLAHDAPAPRPDSKGEGGP